MKIQIPKVVKPLFLRDYAEGFGNEACIWVWVNPPRERLQKRNEIVAEIIRRSAKRALAMKDAGEDVDAQEAIAKSFEKDEMAALDAQLREFLSEIWSQGPEGTGLTPEEIHEMMQETIETDPAFVRWLQERTIEMIYEHRAHQKKS